MADQGNSGNALLERRLQELAEEVLPLFPSHPGPPSGGKEW